MSKPKILLLPDVRGWALDRKADGIIKYASYKYDFTKKYIGEYESIDYDAWDLILLFPWFSYNQLPQPIKREKIIAGISSHRSLDSNPHAKKILQDNFIAIAPTSWLLERELRGEHPNVFYTPNGVDTEVFIDRKTRGDNLLFGWAGKEIWVGKNYQSIIEPAMREENFNPILASKMQKNNISLLTKEEMVNYYNDINVIVCASVSEGAGNLFLEGGACGCILLSTCVGHAKDFGIPDYNYIHVEPNLESFSGGIKRIKKMSTYEREFIRRNLQTTIRNTWSWNVKVENYMRMFDEYI